MINHRNEISLYPNIDITKTQKDLILLTKISSKIRKKSKEGGYKTFDVIQINESRASDYIDDIYLLTRFYTECYKALVLMDVDGDIDYYNGVHRAFEKDPNKTSEKDRVKSIF